MKIELKEITVRELTEGYEDKDEKGVTGYGGKLDIRPPFQREFVYKPKQRDAVIETINNGFPLNVMYWAVRPDGTYEIIDGQQRTVSIAKYVHNQFSIAGMGFTNLQDDQRDRILDYELHVYVCDGTDSEKLDWFETVNIAGVKLTPQELRNAVYAGPWVSDAKRYLSKSNGPAWGVGRKYVDGSPIRQDYLQTAIQWHKEAGQSIEEYMGEHQHDGTATDLWSHFHAVIERTKALFPAYRAEMKKVPWGDLYRDYMREPSLDPNALEAKVARLMRDSDGRKKAGIYRYVFDRDEKHLNLRQFDDNTKREAFERSKGRCPSCKGMFAFEEMEVDHIDPWAKGGKTVAENCQMLCRPCNRRKSDK